MARAARLVPRSSGVRWSLKKDDNILPSLSRMASSLMRKALSDSRAAALSPSCSHGGASLVFSTEPSERDE